MKLICTPDELIDALGGTKAVAELCDLDMSAVSHWRSQGLPRGWHFWLLVEAHRRGLPLDTGKLFGLTYPPAEELLPGAPAAGPARTRAA